MPSHRARSLRSRARSLRSNPTEAERELWRILRQKQLAGHRFRRQHPIGPYVVDFVCLEEKLVIEVDGGQHGQRKDEDSERTDWLGERGYRVIRFWNNEVLSNPEGVFEIVRKALRD